MDNQDLTMERRLEGKDETIAMLLQACNDALFVLQNKSYANTPSVIATLTGILTEAIRKVQP